MMKKVFLLLLICLLTISVNGHDDNTTFSSYTEMTMQHYHLNWTINFDLQEVEGSIKITLFAENDLSWVSLDIWRIHLPGKDDDVVYNDVNNKNVQIDYRVISHSDVIGDQLQIDLFAVNKRTIKRGTQFNLTINYLITNQSKAMSFLKPEQTLSGKQPFMFTQGEPIYARSLAPIMDTPIEKCTWTAEVRAPLDTNVFMSGMLRGSEHHEDYVVFFFEQPHPVATYLLAIVAGELQEQQIGSRTYVIAEPGIIDLAKKELKDLELYLQNLENYIKVPYPWDYYAIVIMPPSFPFGGMENPLLTFASPSIITGNGDQQGVSVAIHEIAHSWTGNMVTCANWQNLWLNEGFTVFLERKTQFALFGEDFYKIQAYNGNSSLMDDYNDFKQQNQSSYASLQPETLSTVNPDDAFSEVPYEKGFQFLTAVEWVLGSDVFMDNFLFEWVWSHPWKSMDSNDFETYFRDFVHQYYPNPDYIFQKINMTQWINDPYMSPQQDILIEKFKTPLIGQSRSLADQFIAYGGQAQPTGWQALKGWANNLQFVFLQQLFDNRVKLLNSQSNFKLMSLLDNNYNFTYNGDKEIQWRWFRACIYTKYQIAVKPNIETFLGQIGRIKMIKPIYQALVDTKQLDYAKQVFAVHQSFYHPIAVDTIKRILFPDNNNNKQNKIISN